MTRVEAVAQAYGLTVDEVQRWSGRTVEIFHRVAVHRGWLIPPNPTRPETT